MFGTWRRLNTIHNLKDNLKDTLDKLREEASEVKRCYTEFAFKALLVATAFFGFLSQFRPEQGDGPIVHLLVWLLCATVVALLMCISRIGYHKYSTANRNYGYELHINRTFHYENHHGHEAMESRMRNIGWEEAMCAWRIVQPIIFETIYRVTHGIRRSLFPLPVRERTFSHENHEYHWWDTQYLMNHFDGGLLLTGQDKLPYHPGRFLRNTQVLIHSLCVPVYGVWTVSYFCCFSSARRGALSVFGSSPMIYWSFSCLYVVVWIWLAWYLGASIWRHRSRRLVLENGLLSIQSCAVVWRLVALAHLKAVDQGFANAIDYAGYTRRLAVNACLIRDNLFRLHKGIMKNAWPDVSTDGIK